MSSIVKTINTSQTKLIANNIVSNYFKININKKTRVAKYVLARSFYYKILKDTAKISLSEIAKSLKPAIRNHATVIHSLGKLEGYMKFDPSLKSEFLSVNKIFIDSMDNLLLDRYNGIEHVDPQYLDILTSFNELTRKYKNLKILHNELIVNNEDLNAKYKKLKSYNQERDSFYERNGYVLNRIKYKEINY